MLNNSCCNQTWFRLNLKPNLQNTTRNILQMGLFVQVLKHRALHALLCRADLFGEGATVEYKRL